MKESRKTSVVRFPGTEMKFIAVEKQVSIVFRHVMFCVNQAETRRGDSNVYQQSMKKKYQTFSPENFQFLKLKQSL